MKYVQPYGVSDPNAGYINGNPATGTMESIPPAASIEHPQREIHNFIADARLIPNPADLHQLGEAVQTNGVVYCDDQGTLNQLVITVAPNVTTLVKGMVFIVQSPRQNTGPATLKVNSLAPVPIVRATDQAPLDLGDIAPNAMLAYGYDGSKFQMVWGQRQPGAPIYLVAPRTYYVNGTTGNDGYDGQAAAVGNGHGPFKTIQRACNQIPIYNMNGYSITIRVADGTYNEGVWVPQMNGSGVVFLYGNSTSPANVHVHATNTSAFRIATQGPTRMDGFKVSCVGPLAPDQEMAGVSLGYAGTACLFDNMEFGTCTGPQLYSNWGAQIGNLTPHTPWRISGNASVFLNVVVNSQFITNAFAGPDLTIMNPVTYTYFVQCAYSSNMSFQPAVINNPGNVTGTRFFVFGNSTIVTGGAGPNYFPGTVPGVAQAASGGYYT